MNERYQYTIKEEDVELSIKEILKQRLNISSRLTRKLKEGDLVYLEGRKVKFFEKGKSGERITVLFPEESSNFPPEPIHIDVIYEDSDILVVNKQAGLVVHPTKGHPSHTIANGLMQYMLDKGEQYKIRFINRLDRDTTGILLVGKNSHCQDDFTKQASEGLVEKKYIAIVKGVVLQDRGTIDLPIGKPVDTEIKRNVIPDGYPSVTHYQVLKRFPKGYTLLRLVLETGRTHQIRVHMSHIEHPVAGDALYGDENNPLISRQALHAEQLNFNHPITNKRISLHAPLPLDMRNLLDLLQ